MLFFSIIVPVTIKYKFFLLDCIRSIESQTAHNFECILVTQKNEYNDIKKILENITFKYRLLTADFSDPSTLRNVGILNAKGDYLIFVDCDDVLEKHYIQISNTVLNKYKKADIILYNFTTDISLLNHNNSNAFYSNDKIFLKNSFFGFYSKNFCNYKLTPKFLFKASPWAKLYNREFVLKSKVLFDANTNGHEDTIFNKKLDLKASSIIGVRSYISYYWRQHGNNCTQTLSGNLNLNIFIENIYPLIKDFKEDEKNNFPKFVMEKMQNILFKIVSLVSCKKITVKQAFKFINLNYNQNSTSIRYLKQNFENRNSFKLFIKFCFNLKNKFNYIILLLNLIKNNHYNLVRFFLLINRLIYKLK